MSYFLEIVAFFRVNAPTLQKINHTFYGAPKVPMICREKYRY